MAPGPNLESPRRACGSSASLSMPIGGNSSHAAQIDRLMCFRRGGQDTVHVKTIAETPSDPERARNRSRLDRIQPGHRCGRGRLPVGRNVGWLGSPAVHAVWSVGPDHPAPLQPCHERLFRRVRPDGPLHHERTGHRDRTPSARATGQGTLCRRPFPGPGRGCAECPRIHIAADRGSSRCGGAGA